MIYSQSEQGVGELPKLQEWAIINRHKGQQYQRMKELQKMEHHEKMMKFKHDLDEQINNKTDVRQIRKQGDKEYSEYVIQQAKEFKRNEQEKKRLLNKKRKQIEEQNQQIVFESGNSRTKSLENSYSLHIGEQSQKERKKLGERGKVQMINELEKQIQEKNEKKTRSKMEDYQLSLIHQRSQPQQFQHHKKFKANKSYKQNQNIFNVYEKIREEKKTKQVEIEQKMVNEAAQRQREEEKQKKKAQNKKKSQLIHHMVDSLEQQVRQYQNKKEEQRRVNPQDVSFSFIGNMFRQKPPAYDKSKYYEQLKKQAEDQRLKKKKQQYMSEQEYKLNRNQLNKIISGQYAQEGYFDRSLGSIGENKRVNKFMNYEQEDENALYIRNRLNRLQGKNKEQHRLVNNSSALS